MNQHDPSEAKPCRECRLQLILAGVDLHKIDAIPTVAIAKDILSEKMAESLNNPIIVNSLNKQRTAPKGCKGRCYSLDGLGRINYATHASCRECQKAIPHTDLKNGRCPCCKFHVRFKSRLVGKRRRAFERHQRMIGQPTLRY